MIKPSPYVSIYISRKQAEALLGLFSILTKRWAPIARATLKALRENAGNATYKDIP